MQRCTFDACPRPYYSKGFCQAHYMQRVRGGTLHAIRERDVGADAQVVFRTPEALRRAMLELAADLDMPESEAWRLAGTRLVAAHERKARRKVAR